MLIDLLRHGETEGGSQFNGKTDVLLTEKGLQQMHVVSQTDQIWDRIISSPLGRCYHFSSLLAQQCAIPLSVDSRLQEMDFGRWEGKSAREIMAETPEALNDFWVDPICHAPPEGEALKYFQQRVLQVWSDIYKSSQHSLLVTHGGVIRIILCHLQSHPVEKILDFDVPHASRWRITINHNNTSSHYPSIQRIA